MPSLRLSVFALAATLLCAACGGSAPSSGVTSSTGPHATATAIPAASGASPGDASPSDGPAATDEPSPTGEPAATDEPSPTDEPAATEAPSAAAGAADACSGSDQNREFFANIAGSVDWPVLCGVLPKGWFVHDGRYRLANGGWLRIGYNGPGGASLWLHEGASCVTNGGCEPSGTDLGGASLGPLEGTLYQTGDGYAILVAPGENPSWYFTTSGLDRATTEELAAKVAQVGG